MTLVTQKSLFLLLVSIIAVFGDFEDSITFTAFTKSGDKFVTTFDDNLTERGCNSSEKVAVIVHGWGESMETNWVNDLIKNLREYRGGCIIFMDYSNHSIDRDYFNLVRKFGPISSVLIKKLDQLNNEGFDDENMFMYGFSFGAQLSIYAGMSFGKNRIAEMDLCDPAGPGFVLAFELRPTFAAKNVQCIHTSSAKGTMKRNCHQDWLMGKCGRAQDAAGIFPRGSHGLCPKFYNSAFTNNFYATENIYRCPSRRVAVNVPKTFKMGYMETRKNKVYGDLFSPTSECYPYNNLPASGIDTRIGPFGRMRRQRLTQELRRCEA